MMKNILSIFLLFMIGFNAYSQKVEYSAAEKTFQRSFSKVIAQTAKGFYVIKSQLAFNNKQEQIRLRDNRVEISYFENNMAVKYSVPMIFPNNDAEIQDIQFLEDSLYVFYSIANKANNRNELFAQRINLENGTFIGQAKLIDAIEFDKRRNKGMFYIKKSKNQKLITSMYKQTSAEDEKLSINIKVMDSTFNTIYTKKYKTDTYDGVLLLNDFKLSNDTVVYFLTSIDLEKKMLRDRKYTLNISKANSDKLQYIALSLDKYFIKDIKMELDYVNKNIVFAGFYSEMNSFSSAGIFYARLNFNELKLKMYSESFKAKFLTEFNTERTVNRGTELINYFVDKIILRTDGGVILVSESNYVTESTNYNSYYQLYTTSYTYHYDNILLFSINTDGKIHWESIIRKNQVSEDDAAFYSSYILSLDVDQIHVIYNKYIRKATDIISCSINNKGETTEKILVKENDNILMMPGGGKQISADQLIVPCIQKNKSNFMRISF
jgi:hypothetical protein